MMLHLHLLLQLLHFLLHLLLRSMGGRGPRGPRVGRSRSAGEGNSSSGNGNSSICIRRQHAFHPICLSSGSSSSHCSHGACCSRPRGWGRRRVRRCRCKRCKRHPRHGRGRGRGRRRDRRGDRHRHRGWSHYDGGCSRGGRVCGRGPPTDAAADAAFSLAEIRGHSRQARASSGRQRCHPCCLGINGLRSQRVCGGGREEGGGGSGGSARNRGG